MIGAVHFLEPGIGGQLGVVGEKSGKNTAYAAPRAAIQSASWPASAMKGMTSA